MNIGRAGSDPPGRTREFTMSKSDRDSLHKDGCMDAAGLSHSEMGTIVHLTLPTGQHQDL